MARIHKKRKDRRQKLASEHIERYFELAQAAFAQDEALAHGYVQDAFRMSMRHKVPIPLPYKRQFCRNCKSFLMPGVNARMRIHRGRVIILCQMCKHIKRIPIR